MVSFNRVVLAGNLTRDPELRFTQGGIPVCGFGVAVNDVRSGKEGAVDFFDVTAWRDLGETVANYKRKGDPVLIEGKLKFSSWEDDDGQRRSKVSVIAQNVQFLGAVNGRGEASGGAASSGSGSGNRSSNHGRRGADVAEVNEGDFDDIPFAHAQRWQPVF